MGKSLRKPTNITLSADLIEEAKALGVNVSQACEKGLVLELKAERNRRWLAENEKAIQSHNEWVERNSLPLEKFRMF